MIDLTKVYEITPQWLAGFFDGEGLVAIYQDNRKNCCGLTVKIAQKDPSILMLIAAKFNNASWGSSQKCGELRYYGKNSREILEYIRPYVIVKKTQVELAIRFLDGERNDIVKLVKQEKCYTHLI